MLSECPLCYFCVAGREENERRFPVAIDGSINGLLDTPSARYPTTMSRAEQGPFSSGSQP